MEVPLNDLARDEDSAPPVRLQPIPKEYEPNLDMPLGDEIPMPYEVAEASRPTPLETDDSPAPQAPEPDLDIEALEAALAKKVATVPVSAQTSYAPHVFWLAAACAVLLLLNVGTAMLVFREALTAEIPALHGLYRAMGYQQTKGLSFADLKLTRYGTEQKPRFDVAGVVVNTMDNAVQEPDVRIALLGKNDEILREWRLNGGEKDVPKDRPLHFSTQKEYLRSARAGEATTLLLHLGSPVELSLATE
jgi:hypothetical protein